MKAYERLLKYVTFRTPSDETSENTPSSACQFELARFLKNEMEGLNLSDIVLDDMCYLYGKLPATKGYENAPAIGFIAHMDTVSDYCNHDITPVITENFNGVSLKLPAGITLSVHEFPHLGTLKERTLITSDGSTILGADDKAGIAEILTMIEHLQKSNIPHGTICIAFTPDEEIGMGAEHFNIEQFGAKYAYTIDGDTEGEIQYENFNACKADFHIKGFNVHPGSAKDTMINASLVAMEINNALPAMETPRGTEDYEGFYHLVSMSGDVSEASLNYIVREAVSCAKRIKTEYKVSEKPVSVCYVGIQELDRVCGISGKHALVIGSGKTAALAIRYLAEYGADVTVCSRTYQHAKDLLKEFPDIQVIAYDKKTEALKNSDMVVSATSSPHLVIKCAELSGGKKMTLLDLAAPRDIEKSAGDICGVTLIDLDRIGGIVKSNQNERAHLLKESQCVIDEYIAETKKWLTSSRMDTTIQSLGKKCDEIVQDSYDYLNRKIDLSDHDRVILKKILKSSLHRLLKEPIEELKNVEENEQQQYKDMVERLFGL